MTILAYQKMTGKTLHIHFVGMGGIGMSGIAELLLNQGCKVSGSDLRMNAQMSRLKSLGAATYIGHAAENIEGCDVLVYSSAVNRENPEVKAALEKPVPVIPRAEMLAELMRMKYSICIGGAHGKTTTSSMVAASLGCAGLDPTVIIGGRLNSINSNAKLGKSDYLVAEADESDGSFLRLYPAIAVVTNIDREHMEHYRNMKAMKKAFVDFVNKVPFYGLGVLCFDDPNVQDILPKIEKRFVTYGFSPQADFRASDLEYKGSSYEYTLWYCKQELGRFSINLMGEHNVLNSLAVIAVAHELNIDFEAVRKALSSFEGIGRRFEIIGEPAGITIVDDYGHHPTEISATLKASSEALKRRIIAVFQPHRYSRTKSLMKQFAKAFNEADIVIVSDIYAASETPIEGVSSGILSETMKKSGHKHVEHIPSLADIAPRLMQICEEGDVVITFGAGDINSVGKKLKELLKAREDNSK